MHVYVRYNSWAMAEFLDPEKISPLALDTTRQHKAGGSRLQLKQMDTIKGAELDRRWRWRRSLTTNSSKTLQAAAAAWLSHTTSSLIENLRTETNCVWRWWTSGHPHALIQSGEIQRRLVENINSVHILCSFAPMLKKIQEFTTSASNTGSTTKDTWKEQMRERWNEKRGKTPEIPSFILSFSCPVGDDAALNTTGCLISGLGCKKCAPTKWQMCLQPWECLKVKKQKKISLRYFPIQETLLNFLYFSKSPKYFIKNKYIQNIPLFEQKSPSKIVTKIYNIHPIICCLNTVFFFSSYLLLRKNPFQVLLRRCRDRWWRV